MQWNSNIKQHVSICMYLGHKVIFHELSSYCYKSKAILKSALLTNFRTRGYLYYPPSSKLEGLY